MAVSQSAADMTHLFLRKARSDSDDVHNIPLHDPYVR